MPAAQLAALIRERQPCVVLTGAGISTESGIPDFRSPTGIWADVDPFEVAAIRAFERDPERVWSFYSRRIDTLRDAEPNAGHYAIAELERRGLVQAVETPLEFCTTRTAYRFPEPNSINANLARQDQSMATITLETLLTLKASFPVTRPDWSTEESVLNDSILAPSACTRRLVNLEAFSNPRICPSS